VLAQAARWVSDESWEQNPDPDAGGGIDSHLAYATRSASSSPAVTPLDYSRTGPTGHAPHARRYCATRWLPCRGARRGSCRVAASDSFTPADRRAGWSAICARIESGYR
jgi:hypothetical protein